jgi:hypothetical protein
LFFVTAEQAVEEFSGQLREALSCIVQQVHLKTPRIDRLPKETAVVPVGLGRPTRLAHNPESSVKLAAPLFLLFQIYIEVPKSSDGFRVTTNGYSYAVSVTIDGRLRNVLSWQWHQHGVSPVTYPHLHVKAHHDVWGKSFPKLHIPTSRVLIEDVIQFLIDDCGVLARRRDWREILDANRALHRERRSW